MKSKQFLIAIALCIGLQSNISFASEKQTWGDWFRAKYAQITGSRDVRVLREKAPVIGLSALVGGAVAPMFTFPIPLLASKETAKLLEARNTQILIAGSILMGALISSIDNLISYYNIGDVSKTDAIIKIKDALRLIISDSSLYPTRSSKIHALLKKDEFLNYITDENGLVAEACNELIGEINSIKYPENQKIADRAIDAKMAEARNIINNYETLEDQIAAIENNLEQKQGFTIPEIQAYLSVYFRLKNKLAVENKLSEEEKSSRQSWATEARKAGNVTEEVEVD